MSLSYARLRQLHFRTSLAEMFRGLGRTALIVVAFFGSFGVLAIAQVMAVLANGLMALTDTQTTTVESLGVVLSWQLVTLGLLWSLRGAIFMRDVEPFLSALPIPGYAVWRADLLIAVQCYSLLWLPLAWLLYTLWGRFPPMQALLASLSYLVMIGTGLASNLALLRGAYRQAATMAVPLLVLMLVRPQRMPGAIVLLGVAVMAVIVAGRMRSQRSVATRLDGRGQGSRERLAVASVLLFPVATHVLRDSLIVRGACLLGGWALAMALLAGHAPGHGLATALLIGLLATASATLHRVPGLIRATMLSRLDFLAGHRRFRWRVTLLAAGLPTALFALCLAVSWTTASLALPVAPSHALLPAYPLYAYAVLFALGALVAIRPHEVMRWLMPTAHFALTLILLMAALT